MKTQLLASLNSWTAACELARGCCNTHDDTEPMQENLLYVAVNSFGGRKVELMPGAKPVHFIPDSFGGWEGFRKEDVIQVIWTSASSGAELAINVTRQEPEEPVLTVWYEGPEGEYESRYLESWIEAANLKTVQVHDLNEVAMRNCLAAPDRIQPQLRGLFIKAIGLEEVSA